MERPLVTHLWCATYDGRIPTDTNYYPLFAGSYDEAVEEYAGYAADYGLPTENVAFWYQLTAAVRSDWTPVGEDTDYREVIKQVVKEFQNPPEADVEGSHPGRVSN